MLRYSDVEVSEPEEEQYTDTLNPPIFLLITLFLVFALGKLVLPELRKAQVPAFLSTDANMLLFRGVTFSIFPVLMAVNLLRHQSKRIDRRTPRVPSTASALSPRPSLWRRLLRRRSWVFTNLCTCLRAWPSS